MSEKFFHPQPDITAYELAVIYANLVVKERMAVKKQPIMFSEDQWLALGEMQRHFANAPMP